MTLKPEYKPPKEKIMKIEDINKMSEKAPSMYDHIRVNSFYFFLIWLN